MLFPASSNAQAIQAAKDELGKGQQLWQIAFSGFKMWGAKFGCLAAKKHYHQEVQANPKNTDAIFSINGKSEIIS